MKRFIAVAVLFLGTQFSFSQSFFSLQYEVAEPTEDFRAASTTGFGVRGTFMRFISPRFALTGSAAYIKWGSRTNLPPNNEYKFVSIPVQLGISLLLSKGVIAPYVGLSMGMDYVRVRGIPANSTTYQDQSSLKFGFRPHVGVGVYLAGPVGLNLTGSYNFISTEQSPTKYFALNAGLAVGF